MRCDGMKGNKLVLIYFSEFWGFTRKPLGPYHQANGLYKDFQSIKRLLSKEWQPIKRLFSKEWQCPTQFLVSSEPKISKLLKLQITSHLY